MQSFHVQITQAAQVNRGIRPAHAKPSYQDVRKSLGDKPLVPGYRLRLGTGDWNADGLLDLVIGNCEEGADGATTGFVRVLLRQKN